MDRSEERVFYDEYVNGARDYYTVTLGELIDTFGYDEAMEVWETGAEKDERYRF